MSPPLRLAYQSRSVLVELRLKLGSPLSKAKYSITTDSGQVRRLNDEKHPYQGSEKYLKPCIYKWSKLYAPQGE